MPTVPVTPELLKYLREAGIDVGTSGAPNGAPDQSEDAFQTEVIALARSIGWRVAHFRKVRIQRPDGSVYWQTPVQADGAGWPDLVLTNGRRIVYAELKSKSGRLSTAQYRWQDDLVGSGCEYYVWKPKDIEQIKRVLGERQ